MKNLGEENEKIEFKSTTSEREEAMIAISSMLNKNGFGTIYFGVNDKGDAKGQQVSDSTKRDISTTIADSIEPKIFPSINIENIDGRKVIKVSFSGTNKPYSAYGRFYIRVGTENRKLSIDELKNLIKNTDYSSKWEKKLTDKTSEDIDEVTLKDFYNNATKCGRLTMPIYDKNRLLTSLDLISENKLNNAGFAIFGKDAKIKLKLALYASDEKLTFLDLKELHGNIYNLVNLAIEYIESKINWRVEIGSRQRNEIPEIPSEAIREIVVNAFAHTNYELDEEVEINIHPGKIVIYNNGSFPNNLTPHDFIKQDISSYKRNPIILDVLFRSKDVEKSGTGFKRVDFLCKEADVKWRYKKEAYGFYFTFLRKNKTNNFKEDDLNDDEKNMSELISSNKKISKEDLAKKIGKSQRTVQRIISSLISKGYVVRIGTNKYGYWQVVNK